MKNLHSSNLKRVSKTIKADRGSFTNLTPSLGSTGAYVVKEKLGHTCNSIMTLNDIPTSPTRILARFPVITAASPNTVASKTCGTTIAPHSITAAVLSAGTHAY